MKCRQFRDELENRFDKRLFDLPTELRYHSENCSECTSFMQGLLELKDVLDKGRPQVAPAELDGITFEKIKALASRGAKRLEPRKAGIVRWVWAPVAAAAIVLLAVGLPKMIDRPSFDYSPIVVLYSISGQQLEDQILESDSLALELAAALAPDTADLDQAADELTDQASFDEILNGLTDSELQALDKNLVNFKG